jgi:hypothetical protein
MAYVEDSPYGGPIDKGDAQRKPRHAKPKSRPSYNSAMKHKKRHGRAKGMRASGVGRIRG